MFDKDDPRSEIVKFLPFFAAIIKSALNRQNHGIPSMLGLVITDAEGQKVPLDVSLDFRVENNLHVFDQMVMPMVRSMVLAAKAHGMTAFSNPFEQPPLSDALEHGVVFSAFPDIRFEDDSIKREKGPTSCEVLPFARPAGP